MSDRCHRTNPALLDVENVTVEYGATGRGQPLRAIDEVSLTVGSCETVGLVGESGSGKSSLGRAILGLLPITGGTISFAGTDVSQTNQRTRRRLSSELQVVFQDPFSSLNPTRTIGQSMAETLRTRPRPSRDEVRDRIHTMLGRVGLPPETADRYPSSFSGGQRQRIGIARALMVQPRLVICDEPISSLDLSIQAQILNLLRELQDEFHISYLFIAHDLAVVRHLCDRIVVLYRGRVVEHGDAAAVYSRPAHPYTRALLDAAPVPDPVMQRDRRLKRTRATESLSPARPDACRFASRCIHAVTLCHSVCPELELTPDGSSVACHRWQEIREDQTNLLPHLETRRKAERTSAIRDGVA
jgi:peptide/nickel transport system ATP-binding protein